MVERSDQSNKTFMATDLSGATVGELQVQGDVAPRADLVTVPDVQPDMTKHDPITYAGLTGQRMLELQHNQGLLPTPDDIKAIESKALEDANNYHRTVAEQAQKERSQLGARQAAVTPAVTKEGVPIPGSSIAEQEETVRRQSAEAQKQWEQTGEIQKLGGDDLAKLDAMTNGYDAVNNLGDYFNKMMEKPHLGVGGQIKSLGGAMHVFADATSPEALAFSRAADAALVPIGRGVMGETGASPTKEAMIELAKTTTMPRIQDSDITGNQGVFQLKQRIMQNLQNLRDNRANNHFDTTAIDKAIAKYNSNFMSPDVQKYNPLLKTSNPLVQSGNSDQANAAIANATTGANAGVQVQNQPVQQPQGQAGAYTTPPGYTPSQPPQPSYGRQSAQAVGAAAGGALKTAGSVIGGGLTSTGELSSGLGTTLNWLGGLLPENWSQQAFQQPRPWETTSNQFVGTGQ
jgi:hypothetical protein